MRPVRRAATALAVASAAWWAGAAPVPAQPALSAPHTTILPPAGQGLQLGQPTAVGDVNGDKLGDLLVQPRTDYENEACVSTAYVVLGTFSPSTLRLGALGSRGITITNLPGCVPLWGIAALGDVNGDGRSDIGIGGDPFTTIPPTVIFGRAAGSTVSFTAPGSGGLKFAGGATIAPTSIASVGDVNGDGRPDIGLGGRYGTFTAGRNVAGVVFSRPGMSGTLDLTNPATAGLLIGDASAPAFWGAGGAQIYGVGDLNGDGRADVVTTAARPRVVYGRATPGLIDVARAGASVPLGDDLFGVFSEIDTMLRPDVNGDGAKELAADEQGGFTLVQSSRAAPHFDLTGATRPPLAVFASLGLHYGSAVLDDVSGDGRRDLLTTAVYPMRDGPFVQTETGGLAQSYLVSDLRPRNLDLRTATTGVRKLPISEPVLGGTTSVRFRGTIRPQVARHAWEVEEGPITVHDVVERPDPPVDTTPPVISDMAFDRASITSACPEPCYEPEQAVLTLKLSEASYLEFDLRRGATVVSRTRGPVWGTSDHPSWGRSRVEWKVAAVGAYPTLGEKLPAGTYTAVIKPTDMAGNVGATQTATIQVTG